MKILTLTMILITTISVSQTRDWTTYYENNKLEKSAPYDIGIDYFKKLANSFDDISIQEMGQTDSGIPLHLIIYSKGGEFDISKIKESKRPIIFINNAIHPGEPDGIEASMLLLRELALKKTKLHKKMKDVVLAIVPYYNIGGVLNRNSHTRANQNGPTEYGFRGNARNYDLNRDMIKTDTRNSQSLQEIFHMLDPDLFLDNHVSNGANYQHIVTLLQPVVDRLSEPIKDILEQTITPSIYKMMKKEGLDMVPYVNIYGNNTPDKGYNQMVDYSRYTSGYVGLFHTLGFTVETHMLKEYKLRVDATYKLMKNFAILVQNQKENIIESRAKAKQENLSSIDLDWKLDKSKHQTINFKGYEYELVKSGVSGLDRLKYYDDKPVDWEIPFYNNFEATKTINIPKQYIIPQGWHRVIELLKLNDIKMSQMESSETIKVTVTNIKDYKTSKSNYEGHYRHSNIETSETEREIIFRKGDYIIETKNQEGLRYIIETLEIESPDSFFSWNYFDTRLQQKEHFSAYVFEDKALEILNNKPKIKEALEKAKANNSKLRANANQQLQFVYETSQIQEKEYLEYPIYKIY
ncbi:MAG: hypothetical protein HRT66_09510 [Flavobacteriaceae bacterium]|nr:hypothetical protein [Flavobacteriaceae bacterium]